MNSLPHSTIPRTMEQSLIRLNVVKVEPGVEESSDEDSEELRVVSPSARKAQTPKRKREY